MATGADAKATQVVMMSSNMNPPGEFNFQQPEKWPVWRKRFERYSTVSKLDSNSNEREKIDTCLYCMGEKSEEVLLQINSEPKTLKELLVAFDNYFQPQKNIIFERFKFNTRVQQPGEPVDEFITDLHTLAEHCEFRNLKEELIRDRIVVGMQNVKVSEQLQLKNDLTLKFAVDSARQAEMQSKQTKVIREEKVVNIVRGGKEERSAVCGYCGYGAHDRLQCPARKVTCYKCKGIGHYRKVCRKNVFNTNNSNNIMRDNVKSANNNNRNHTIAHCESNRNVELGNRRSDVDSQDEYFLGSVSSLKDNGKSWYVKCFARELNCEIEFLVDTGADCICLPSDYVSVSEKIQTGMKVQNHPQLKSADGKILQIVGSIELALKYTDEFHKFVCYLVQGLKVPLLGINAIRMLKVLAPPENCFAVSEDNEYEKILEVDNNQEVMEREGKIRERNEINYNKRHKSMELSELTEGERVWITDLKSYGIIIEKLEYPRSYLVKTSKGTYRRNRWHLVPARMVQHQGYDYSSEINFNPDINIENGNIQNEIVNRNTTIVKVNDNQIVNEDTVPQVELMENGAGSSSGISRPRSPQVELMENGAGSSSGISRPRRKINPPSHLDDYIVD